MQQRIFFALQIAQAMMDVLNETMEMHPVLRFDRNRVEKHVHQEALAPPHTAPDIKTADRTLAQEHPHQRISCLLRLDEFVMQALEMPDCLELRRIERKTMQQ